MVKLTANIQAIASMNSIDKIVGRVKVIRKNFDSKKVQTQLEDVLSHFEGHKPQNSKLDTDNVLDDLHAKISNLVNEVRAANNALNAAIVKLEGVTEVSAVRPAYEEVSKTFEQECVAKVQANIDTLAKELKQLQKKY